MIENLADLGVVLDPLQAQFERRSIPAISTGGTPYVRQIEVGMPSLPQVFFDSVFYLYPTVDAAKKGQSFGGTGFIVGVPLGHDRFLFFAVTNWHVAVKGGCSVIRVNTKAGGVDIFDLDPSQWWFQPKGHDLAIATVPLDRAKHAFEIISMEMAATDEEIKKRGISAGEDIFMIGRFVDHDGAGTNIPAVRFGNVSVMPQPILQPTGAILPSYILDVHSRTGYSGSPVFAYRTLGADFNTGNIEIGGNRSRFILLLGIHWGQFPEEWEIKTGKTPVPNAAIGADDKYVKGMSGMTMAVPITALVEIFENEPFKKVIEAAKALIAKQFSTEPTAEMAAPQTDNPSHKEDFTSLLSAAARSNKPAS